MNNVKVFVSMSLVALAVAHAAIVGLVVQSSKCDCTRPHKHWASDVYMHSDPPADFPQVGSSSGINAAALHENKQGGGAPQQMPSMQQGVVSQASPCMPCNRVPYAPTYQQPGYPYYAPQPTPAPALPSARPTHKPYKIALFLNGSAKSNEVLQWFSRDQQLANLRTHSEFQVYTPGDTLYRQRYASIVPVQAMPAVLWSYQPAGDVNNKQAAQIFAGGGDHIQSPQQLVSDMRQAYGLFVQVKAAPAAQSYEPSFSYNYQAPQFNWSNFAPPTLVLNQATSGYEDCPDGKCPNDRQPPSFPDESDQSGGYRPFDERRPAEGPVRDLAALSTESLIAVGILVVVAVVAVMMLNKKP